MLILHGKVKFLFLLNSYANEVHHGRQGGVMWTIWVYVLLVVCAFPCDCGGRALTPPPALDPVSLNGDRRQLFHPHFLSQNSHLPNKILPPQSFAPTLVFLLRQIVSERKRTST
jgi:hypothetical protein